MTSTAFTSPQKYIIVSSKTIFFFTSVTKGLFLVNKHRKLLLHFLAKHKSKQAEMCRTFAFGSWIFSCVYKGHANQSRRNVVEDNANVSWKVLSRTVKGLRLYPMYKLPSLPNSFMDTGRRHEVPGSEMGACLLLPATAVARASAFLCWSPRDVNDTFPYSGWHRRRGVLSSGLQNLLWRAVGMLPVCSRVRCYLCRPEYCQPFVLEHSLCQIRLWAKLFTGQTSFK